MVRIGGSVTHPIPRSLTEFFSQFLQTLHTKAARSNLALAIKQF